MDIASLILGIVTIIISFIPIVGLIAFIPAIAGLTLGIVSLILKVKANELKGMSIAGTVLNASAIVIMVLVTIIFSLVI